MAKEHPSLGNLGSPAGTPENKSRRLLIPSLRQLSLNTKMLVIMLGISLAARGQQRSGPANATNNQHVHVLTDDAMNNLGEAHNEKKLNNFAKATQISMQSDIRNRERAVMIIIDREHTPALTGSGNASTDVNNLAQYMINPDNNCDPRDYQLLYTGVPFNNGNAGYTPGASPNQGWTWSVMVGSEFSGHESHTGPHEFAASTGSLSSSYIESRSNIEYTINDNIDEESETENNGITKGAGGGTGQTLPVYATDIAYNRGTIANGGDGIYHTTEKGTYTDGTPFSFTYDIAPDQLENLNGATPVNTGINTFYETYPEKARTETTYYDPTTDTQKPFENPVAADFSVDSNGIVQFNNEADYSLKIPNTLDQNFAADHYTPGEYHICLFPTDNVTNNSHVAKIPLKEFDGFDLNSLNLTSDNYTAVVYEYWSNSIDHNNTSNTVITLGVDKHEIPGFSLYPNPTKGIIHIKNDGSEVIKKIEISNLSGQKVINAQQNIETIDISDFPEGIYFIKVITESGKINVYKEVKI